MSRSSFKRQLAALLMRNILAKKRNKKQTSQEVLFPVYMVIVLAILHYFMATTTLPPVPLFPVLPLGPASPVSHHRSLLLAWPTSPAVERVVSRAATLMPWPTTVTLVGGVAEAERLYATNASRVFAGVGFDDAQLHSMTYTIRMARDDVATTELLFSGQEYCRSEGSKCLSDKYRESGFVVLQRAIDTALRQEHTGVEQELPEVDVQQLPKSSWQPDIQVMQLISSLYLVMAFAPIVGFLCVRIVTEKEKGIRENMRMMGMRTSAYWLSWLAVYVALILVISLLSTLVAVVAGLFHLASAPLLFVLIALYGVTLTGWAFLLAPLFRSVQVAGTAVSLLSFGLSLVYLPVSLTRVAMTPTGPVYGIPPGALAALGLLSPVAFAAAIDQGIFLDTFHGGMTFANIGVGHFPIYASLIMFVVDFLLYFLLAAYLDSVIPGEYGQHQPPYFCLLPSFWCRRSRSRCPDEDILLDTVAPSGDNAEEISAELQHKNVIRIRNLCKVFHGKTKKAVTAVDDFSLDIYEGQITAILGHNGAGKTTLLNLLSGLVPVTSGAATIYGLNVANMRDQAEIREMTGVCPQQNILVDELTCAEQLRFFAHMKGVAYADVEAQVVKGLQDVDLTQQKDSSAQELSGGQKRKLAVAIALIGDPKVIFLDEPTSGMDPYSRRQLWTLLKNNRAGRVILLTTHFMDEADILADRKVFLSQGKLKCVGSSIYLKNRFGLGYHMAVVRAAGCDVAAISRLVTTHVPTATVARHQNQEVIYTLPLAAVDQFADLFGAVELCIASPSGQNLGIQSYGISMTTLEEVFLKIGIEETEDSADDGAVDVAAADDRASPMPEWSSLSPTSGAWLRLRALLRVRMLMMRRERALIFSRLILPIMLVIAAALLQKFMMHAPSPTSTPPLTLTPLLYARSSHGGHNPTFYTTATGGRGVADFIAMIRHQGLAVSTANATDFLATAPHYLGLSIANVSLGQQRTSCRLTLLHNDTAVHALPALVSVVSNALLLLSDPAAAPAPAATPRIAVASHPWPTGARAPRGFDGGLFGSTVLLSIALAALPASFAVGVVKDRQAKARSLLRISGVTMDMYWLSTGLFDVLQYAAVAAVTILILLACQVAWLAPGGAIVCVSLLFVLYIPAMLLFAYVLSFAFDKHETAQSFLAHFFTMASSIPFMPVVLLDMFGMPAMATTLHTIFTVFDPPYVIFGGLYYIQRVYTRADRVGDAQPDIHFADYFKWDNHISLVFLMAVVHGVIFYVALRVVEVRMSDGDVADACRRRHNAAITTTYVDVDTPTDTEQEDVDVSAERTRVSTWDMSEQPAVMVSRLSKEFRTGCACWPRGGATGGTAVVAVCDNSFAVEAGEVFGLLGPNGAGKTTTLNMIIAETAPTRGHVYVAGHDVRSNLSAAFSAIGYCPQHDALWKRLSLREHLECYAAVQGIPPQQAPDVINYYINALHLSEHADKYTNELSGGTKRKLSYIISMLGKPSVVLMDEPSTGMDPRSKRLFWKLIQESFSGEERGAILTTHYMEEADTLCSRIAIMVNGRMQCIGTSQHLKNRFGSGYVLEVKLAPVGSTQQRLDSLHVFLNDVFASRAEVVECFGERVTYKIGQADVGSLSHAFKSLEEAKKSLTIEEYSFSQCSLEQVFIQFAKKQKDEEVKVTDSKTSTPQN